jgi:nucleoside-diphosphate-sugar epimerase
VKEIERNEAYARKVNIDGTMILANAFKNNSGGVFIYVSSSHVYATTRKPNNENSITDPINIYGEQKLETENLLQDLFSSCPERLIIVRVFSLLDWDMPEFSLGGGIRKLALGDKKYRLLFSDDTRDFLTPKTVAITLMKILSIPAIHGIYNICTGVGTKVADAARFMLSESGFKVHEGKICGGISDNPLIVGDPHKLFAKMNTTLKWKPSVFNPNNIK